MQVPGGGAPVSAFAALSKSMDHFASGAAGGAFAVNETGGQALLSAIRNMKDWVDENRSDLHVLGDEPKLGTSNGAQVMKPYVANVANDDQGFLPMLLKFRESLESAEQGIIDAMNNYRRLDYDGAHKYSS